MCELNLLDETRRFSECVCAPVASNGVAICKIRIRERFLFSGNGSSSEMNDCGSAMRNQLGVILSEQPSQQPPIGIGVAWPLLPAALAISDGALHTNCPPVNPPSRVLCALTTIVG